MVLKRAGNSTPAPFPSPRSLRAREAQWKPGGPAGRQMAPSLRVWTKLPGGTQFCEIPSQGRSSRGCFKAGQVLGAAGTPETEN